LGVASGQVLAQFRLPEKGELLFLLGVTLLLLITLRGLFARHRRSRTSKAGRPAVPKPIHSSELIDAPPEVVRWQVAMHDTARELKAELDSKMSALQALIQMAREERERLEAVLRRIAETERKE
jgi:hypothetical protein